MASPGSRTVSRRLLESTLLMSTLTVTTVPASRRSTGVRIFLWLLLVLALLVAAVVAFAYFVARSALPQLDGNLAVKGLSAPVKVTRDSHGVPAIEAATLEDLFFAQGYVTAQDRLWQMDIMRRFAAGEFPRSSARTRSRSTASSASWDCGRRRGNRCRWRVPGTASYFDAYARGVNAFIESHGSSLPIEFRILKYRPKPWQAEDSIVIANQMVKDLNYYTFGDTLAREKILAKLGPELTADLYVNRSWHDRPPTVMREDLNDQTRIRAIPTMTTTTTTGPDNSVTQQRGAAAEIWAQHAPEAVNGSNDWVVSGAHTVTGKPLLSNDMHLGHQMPNLWYEAHLKCVNQSAAWMLRE